MDGESQSEGNMRNKILKYGPKVALKLGDLAHGYVTGLSKAGCFVQIGHNTSVRAALTELSDDANFDFKSQMAIGMMVLGRITKAE
jgi:predicted RNA-binding protein with RPS1 domain